MQLLDVATPIFFQRPSLASANVDARERARSRVEAGGEYQDVEIILCAVHELQPVRRNPLNRVLPDADDFDVGSEELLEKTDFQRDAVRSEAVIFRDQDVAEPRILQPRAHLFADEIGDLLAHLLVEEQFRERCEPQLERTVLPDVLQDLAPSLGRAIGPTILEVVFEAGEGVGQALC
jgi:hypothetical protein